MSGDFHIKFEGVEGEATHKDHKGEIDVISWTWDVQQDIALSGSGTGRGKAEPGKFNFTHHYDKSSPVLAKQCVSGKHFTQAVLTARKAGEGQKDYLKVTLKEVFITRIAPYSSGNGEVGENVSCSYKDIEFAYKPQDEKGSLGGEVKFGWNVQSTETR